jgi:hypothetical protein
MSIEKESKAIEFEVFLRAKIMAKIMASLTAMLAAIALSNPPAAIAQSDVPVDIPADIPEEIPEEILRTEIITEARSPITGEPMSAAAYAQLQAELASPAGESLVNPEIRYLIFLLQLRQSFGPILPFIR